MDPCILFSRSELYENILSAINKCTKIQHILKKPTHKHRKYSSYLCKIVNYKCKYSNMT